MNKLKAIWGAIPHPIQALIVTFVSAAVASLGQALSNPQTLCFTVVCLKGYAGGMIAAGIVACRAFYMLPNRTAPATVAK